MYKSICAAACIVLLPSLVLAQNAPGAGPQPAVPSPSGTPQPGTAAPETTKPAEAPKPPPWYSSVVFSGTVDASYQARFDAAQDVPLGLRAFDQPLGFTLGDAILSAAMAPGPVGFRLDLQFGNAASIVDGAAALSAGTSTPTIANHVLQAYAAMKLGPVELDAGRFVTLAGAEVVPAKDNWLYSRSLLFNLIPITHTGARVKLPLSEQLTVYAGINNGWDAVTTSYSGKTGEIQVAYSGANSTTLSLTGYFGPNPTVWSATSPTGAAPNTSSSWRSLVDAVAGTAIGPVSVSANFDWGDEAGHNWYGGALMGRYALAEDKARITVRGEYVEDSDGVRFLTATGTNVWELTGGISVPVGSNGELRAEVRYDKASAAIFSPTKDDQITGTIAALAWF